MSIHEHLHDDVLSSALDFQNILTSKCVFDSSVAGRDITELQHLKQSVRSNVENVDGIWV